MGKKRWVPKGTSKSVGYRKTGNTRKVHRVPREVPNSSKKFRISMCYSFGVSPMQAVANTEAFWALTVPLNFPGQLNNLSGTYGPLTASAGGINVAYVAGLHPRMFAAPQMFDMYRVRKLKVKFYPQDVQANTAANYYTIDQPDLIYAYKDYDDINLLASEVQALNDGIRPKQYTRGTMLSWTMRNLKALQGRWINTSLSTTVSGSATTQGTIIPENCFAGIKFGFPLNQANLTAMAIGRFFLEYDVEFKSLRNIAV